MHIQRAARATTGIAVLALVRAGTATLLASRLSDRVPRSLVVFWAGVPMALATLGFALDPTRTIVIGAGILYGMGYGVFVSVDWALALDSIPDLSNVARDLGIWGIASGMPSVVAPLLGGWILSRFVPVAAGYRILYLAAGLAFALGSVWVLRLEKPAKPKDWSVALVTCVAIVLKTYGLLHHRVRLMGRLPKRRTLVIVANHAHDADSVVLPATLTLRHGIFRPLISSGSQWLFEPGFLAEAWVPRLGNGLPGSTSVLFYGS